MITLKQVRAVLADPKSRSEEYTVATDCAVGSLGKLALEEISVRESIMENWKYFIEAESKGVINNART